MKDGPDTSSAICPEEMVQNNVLACFRRLEVLLNGMDRHIILENALSGLLTCRKAHSLQNPLEMTIVIHPAEPVEDSSLSIRFGHLSVNSFLCF